MIEEMRGDKSKRVREEDGMIGGREKEGEGSHPAHLWCDLYEVPELPELSDSPIKWTEQSQVQRAIVRFQGGHLGEVSGSPPGLGGALQRPAPFPPLPTVS